MGFDMDNAFKFCTPKYVYIRDAKLGIMKYAFMALIFFYVIVYQILYKCNHLSPHHAAGFGTISMQHPVEDCDDLDPDCLNKFDNIVSLPYCQQYKDDKAARKLAEKGDAKSSKADASKDDKEVVVKDDKEEDGKSKGDAKSDKGDGSKGGTDIGELITDTMPCRYLDNRRLEWEGSTPSEIFIPTHYKHITQTFDGDCYDPDKPNEDMSGRKKYRCKSAWKTDTQREYFIADIENFKLRMSHSFSSPAIGLHGVSTEFQGIFAACPTNHPLDVNTECKRMKVPGSKGPMADEDIKGLITADEAGASSMMTSPGGEDEITFRDLLRLTPVAQRNGLKDILDAKLPDSFGHEGKSIREVGGMLLLDVDYENDGLMRPGLPVGPQIKPITYLYRPYFVPTTRNEKYQLVERSDYSGKRTIDVWYGMTIKMQFNGKLVAFSWSKLLTALTTGLVLLSMATTIVSAFAAYILPLKEKYGLLMYQLSEDFSDYSTLRNNCAKFPTLNSVFSTGHTLGTKLGVDGTPSSELTNAELVQILCTTEMRLNRLDGQDPRCVFPAGDENNKINRCIGLTEKKFYTHELVNLNQGALDSMAFNVRCRKPSPAPE